MLLEHLKKKQQEFRHRRQNDQKHFVTLYKSARKNQLIITIAKYAQSIKAGAIDGDTPNLIRLIGKHYTHIKVGTSGKSSSLLDTNSVSSLVSYNTPS